MIFAIQPENAWLIPVAIVAPFIPLGLFCIAESWYYRYKAAKAWSRLCGK